MVAVGCILTVSESQPFLRAQREASARTTHRGERLMYIFFMVFFLEVSLNVCN